jgi:hypothetical protein
MQIVPHFSSYPLSILFAYIFLTIRTKTGTVDMFYIFCTVKIHSENQSIAALIEERKVKHLLFLLFVEISSTLLSALIGSLTYLLFML